MGCWSKVEKIAIKANGYPPAKPTRNQVEVVEKGTKTWVEVLAILYPSLNEVLTFLKLKSI